MILTNEQIDSVIEYLDLSQRQIKDIEVIVREKYPELENLLVALENTNSAIFTLINQTHKNVQVVSGVLS